VKEKHEATSDDPKHGGWKAEGKFDALEIEVA
jgi:hypothetical protein